ncbi:MAG TPA: hypothetical protein DDY78_11550, partial [Planctomycetales bacterium]|nr:hypothetical protein [Planctomycetales bacterium]
LTKAAALTEAAGLLKAADGAHLAKEAEHPLLGLLLAEASYCLPGPTNNLASQLANGRRG